eukprot:PhF_6_TR37730/c0_g1_i2/m.56175
MMLRVFVLSFSVLVLATSLSNCPFNCPDATCSRDSSFNCTLGPRYCCGAGTFNPQCLANPSTELCCSRNNVTSVCGNDDGDASCCGGGGAPGFPTSVYCCSGGTACCGGNWEKGYGLCCDSNSEVCCGNAETSYWCCPSGRMCGNPYQQPNMCI